jgi:hypothetical protein
MLATTEGRAVVATPLIVVSVIRTDFVPVEMYFGLCKLLATADFAGTVIVNLAVDLTEDIGATEGVAMGEDVA